MPTRHYRLGARHAGRPYAPVSRRAAPPPVVTPAGRRRVPDEAAPPPPPPRRRGLLAAVRAGTATEDQRAQFYARPPRLTEAQLEEMGL